jgi:hypothetical protein
MIRLDWRGSEVETEKGIFLKTIVIERTFK